MQTVILCGGLGTRLSEETHLKPKPMVEIGHKPILWHIMKIYAHFGKSNFVLALGYKSKVIKAFFANYHLMTSDLIAHVATGKMDYQQNDAEDWVVQMMETGQKSMTGGRLLRLKELLQPQGTFMLTYGDGVTDLHVADLIKFHRQHGKLATVTAVHPPSRFGAMRIEDAQVTEFAEKPQASEGWISGGFFVFEPGIFDYLTDDATVLEREPLENLARDGQLMAYKHKGFWMCMDTLRDKKALEAMWAEQRAPWKVW